MKHETGAPAGPDDATLAGAGPDARGDIGAAIAAANHPEQGALFDPLLLLFARSSDFDPVWVSQRGDCFIQFLRFNNRRRDGFLPMGDFALTTQGTVERAPIMLARSERPGMLAHPVDFEWILDDHGSGNPTRLSYWWPVAPPGYQALGICVGTNGARPEPTHYWCVSSSLLQPSGCTTYWSDRGQHWRHNGSLSVPAAGGVASPDKIVLAPTTLLSDEGGAPNRAECLVLGKLFLAAGAPAVPSPTYDPNFGRGTCTARGIQHVAVLPCSVVADPSSGANPQNSPFYYLAAQPYWHCVRAFGSPRAGAHAGSYAVGTSCQESGAFRHATSLGVGADVGVEAGDAAGYSARVAVAYTREMGLAGSLTRGMGPEAMQVLSVSVPAAQRVLVWQKNVELVAYRTNGQALARATFQTSEIACTGSNAV